MFELTGFIVRNNLLRRENIGTRKSLQYLRGRVLQAHILKLTQKILQGVIYDAKYRS